MCNAFEIDDKKYQEIMFNVEMVLEWTDITYSNIPFNHMIRMNCRSVP